MGACFLATIILPSSFDCKALTYLKLLECRAQSNDKSSRTLNLGTPHHLSFIHIDTFTFTLALSITWYLYHKPPHTLTLNLTHSSSLSPCLAHTNILRHGFTRAHTTERERDTVTHRSSTENEYLFRFEAIDARVQIDVYGIISQAFREPTIRYVQLDDFFCCSHSDTFQLLQESFLKIRNLKRKRRENRIFDEETFLFTRAQTNKVLNFL